MKKLIIGNWKMNGRLAKLQSFVDEWEVLADQAGVEVGIAAPAPYLAALQNQAKGLLVCAQDVSHFANDGAYTGEVSAGMLADMGSRYVLVGHSERRQYFSENNAILAQKLNAVMDQNMVPVLCIGETLAQRESGEYCQVIREQLAVLQDVDSKNHEFVVAYEPVWAIGTGKVASLEQIHEIHVEIKSWLLQNIGSADSIRVLYGGSVNEKNAEAIMSVPNVDGALVGGASLDAKAFRTICEAVEKLI